MYSPSPQIEPQLTDLGWSPRYDLSFVDADQGCRPGRVVIMHGQQTEVAWFPRDAPAVFETIELTKSLNLRPVAGDWVSVQAGQLVDVGPRRTSLQRPDPNARDTQVLAANIDTVMIVMPIDRPLNLKALERLQVMGWDSGADPLLVLTKADGCADVEKPLAEVASVAPGLSVVVTSAVDGTGLDELRSHLVPGSTATMLGASGVGKTSLLNALGGADEAVFEVRADGQGRHTTTTRRLFLTPSGGVMLDVPGIRSLDLFASEDAVSETFNDIIELADECRFRDCRHDGDSGCAVEAAVEVGDMPQRRLDSWRAIRREMAYHETRQDPAAMAARRTEWKRITKEHRNR